jgi:hypothetical protein
MSDDFTWAKLDKVLLALPVERLTGDRVIYVESFIGVPAKEVSGSFDEAGLGVEWIECDGHQSEGG